MPSNVLALRLKKIFLPIIWIFTEGEGDGIESRQPFKIFSTLLPWQSKIHLSFYSIYLYLLSLQHYSEYRSTYKWHEFTPNTSASLPAASTASASNNEVVVKKPPKPISGKLVRIFQLCFPILKWVKRILCPFHLSKGPFIYYVSIFRLFRAPPST